VSVGPPLAFLSAVLGCAGLLMFVPARPVRRRRPSAGDPMRAGERLNAAVLSVLATAGRRLRPGADVPPPPELAARLAAAGLSGGGIGVQEVMAAKLGAAVAAGVVGAIGGAALPGRLGIALVISAPAAGFLAPDLWLARRAADRARRVRRELPARLDLLRVSVEAGASLPAALAAVGERATGPLATEWRAVGRRLELGVPLGEALGEMTARLPLAEIRAVATALERAARHGSPLGETLAAQARDARFNRRRRIQEEAARAGPKIQLAVALLLVPSVLLLVAAALVTALVDSGQGLLVG
jgi:tight adherence protein C